MPCRLPVDLHTFQGMLKVSLYFDQSKTKLADYQTFSVAVDVASLTQEQIP
ncbi:hypothetical protein GT718_11885 [Blautia massiliensis]|uniref:Uncharacterized protein n=1 Tax=Blautia massiliensis (ex Durand et al. 2017) TaxID=1737424 RepID=A0ABW9X7C2_9FIRM|nr:hypothetical protein [Blautia massiliensis (ex Durand et al. 2017)]